MKTVFIDCSPKKRLSASGFIADLTSVFVTGQKVKETLRKRTDTQRILSSLRDADNVVFSMPLYVDGVPSHVLPFLKEMERHCKANGARHNVYAIANNGFIEGKQNEPLMQVMENFSRRSGLNWCGGLGIGGGVMMNVMRILVPVFCAIAIVNILLNGIVEGDFLRPEPIVDLALQVLSLLVFGSGILVFDIMLASSINKQAQYGKRYTRMLLLSFVFILFADVFFVIASLIKGGIFRGWLAKKKPTSKAPLDS